MTPMEAAESRWTLEWDERASEEKANLNPAFCAEIIGRAVCEYHQARTLPLNLAVSFLILPLTLHHTTRRTLPRRASVAFASWIANNNPLLAELPRRMIRLRPITREALIFALSNDLLAFQDGGIVPGERPILPRVKVAPTTDDADDIRKTANMLGRWFSNQSSQLTILRGMGVAP